MTQILETIPSEPTQTDVQTTAISSSIDILTLEEAADYLRFSPERLQRAAEKSHLPGRLLDGEWRFSKVAIDHWLSTPEPPKTQRYTITQADIDRSQARRPHLRALLKSWDVPENEAEHTETWNYLKVASLSMFCFIFRNIPIF